MDPIITPALLVALAAAVKEKAVGAAAEHLMTSVKVQAQKLRGLLPDGNEAKLARALVDHVLAEMAAYPPGRAVLVEPIATSGVVGIWAPRGRLQLHLLWVNHADFPVQVRDVHVTARVGTGGNEWDATIGDEFTLGARSWQRRQFNADPIAALPSLAHGGVQCELTVDALVSGPWNDGRAQLTHDLVRISTWMPALGFEPTGLMTDDKDVDLMLTDYLREFIDKGDRTVRINYAEVDAKLTVRSGGTKARLPSVCTQGRHQVDSGPSVAIVKFYDPPSPESFIGGGMAFGTGGRSSFDDPDY
jgi:hypothetical protein